MTSRLLLFAFAATLALSQSSTNEHASGASGLDMQRLQTIRPRLQALVDSQTIPGAVALVARHGKVALLEAVGSRDIENRKPMQADSIFQIMSMTKNFTGVAVMMLVEEGKIDLRRPVEDYLPEFRGIQIEEHRMGPGYVHPPLHPPKLWQLMNHTSGLGDDPEGEMADNPRTMRVPLADAVRFYAHTHLQFEPGARWSYSNMGISTLGHLVEVISGEDYVHFLRTHILDPLGMKDSFIFPPDDKKDRIALVYKHADGKLVRSGAEILAGDATKYRQGARYPAPEFGLYSTAPDLAKFYQMLLNGGEYEGRRYLSRQAVATMTRVFTPDVKPSGWMGGGTGYGLTFEIVKDPEGTLLMHSPGTFGHGGAFGTQGWIDPKNDLISIMLVQVSDGDADEPRSVVMQIGEAAVE